jgi:hypothetical protein
MNGTLEKVLADNPQWAYLTGEGDPPPVKARRTRAPRTALYARADHQTEIIPGVVGDTASDDRPPLYQVGGKLREWCDANCLREADAAAAAGGQP